MTRLIHLNKLYLFSFLLILFYDSVAQQSVLLNQSSYNLFTINPAALNLNSSVNANIYYKKNWIGMPDSPEAINFTIDGGISKSNIGLGLSLTNEKAGIYSKSNFSGAINYKLKVVKEHLIYFGLSFGFQKVQSDFSKIKSDHPDEFLLWPQQQSVTRPDAAFGLVYNYKRFRFGASATQLLQQNYSFNEPVYKSEINYSSLAHYIFSLQYKIEILKNEWQMIPHLFIRTPQGLPIQLDILNTFIYQEKIFLGLGYRNKYALYLNVGYSVNEHFRLMYSYENSLAIQEYTKSGHEIGLSYCFAQAKGNRKSSKDLMSNESISDVYMELDSQKQNVQDLTRKIDSLDRNIEILQEKISLLKSQQIRSDEIENLDLNQTEKNKGLSAIQNEIQKKRSAVSSLNRPNEQFSRLSIDEHQGLSSTDSINQNFKIVLGVYQLLNYAKKYQKFLKREMNIETILFEIPNHPKKYIYVCLMKQYSQLNSALLELDKINKLTHSTSEDITNGDSWILQTTRK